MDFAHHVRINIFNISTINYEVPGGQASATGKWCRHASEHATTVGGRPWVYRCCRMMRSRNRSG
jgi:hypothetical protein